MFKKLILIASIIASFIACGNDANKYLSSPNQLEIMTYNVENLFDTVHDEGRNDWMFTPGTVAEKRPTCEKNVRNKKKYRDESRDRYFQECINTNWTKEALQVKLEQIKRVVTRNYNGDLPDVLALTEVENGKGRVIETLQKHLGYKNSYIANTDDRRGIATAVLYNADNSKFDSSFTMKFDELIHPFKVEGQDYKTRRVLVFKFKVQSVDFKDQDNQIINLFVNHWPSQGAPSAHRVAIAKSVRDEAYRRLQNGKHEHVIITGDFNVIEKDYPHAYNSVLLNGNTLKTKDVDGKIVEKEYNLMDVWGKNLSYTVTNKLPLGTYFYSGFGAMQWNTLDMFFVDKGLLKSGYRDHRNRDHMSIIKNTFEIYAPYFIKNEFVYEDPKYPNFGSIIKGKPKRYNFQLPVEKSERQGFSDHFPILMRIAI